MSQNQTCKSIETLSKFKEDFAKNFKNQCIFRALSLVNIEKKVIQFTTEPIVYSNRITSYDSKNLGYHYANIENDEIIRNFVMASKYQQVDIFNELKAQYGKILVLFGFNIFWNLRVKYRYQDNEKQIGNFTFGRLKTNKSSIIKNDILTITHFNGINIPKDGVLIFKSEGEFDFNQLVDNNQEMILNHTIEQCPNNGMMCNNITLSPVEKINGINCIYACNNLICNI